MRFSIVLDFKFMSQNISFYYLSVLVALVIFCLPTNASTQDVYKKVKIYLDQIGVQDIADLGVDVCHGDYLKGRHFISEFSTKEVALFEDAGFNYDILVEDVAKAFLEGNSNLEDRDHDDCNPRVISYETPSNFVYGSMGGYYSYADLLDQLDLMRNLYPNLISARSPISSINSYEGRPIFSVRISDNADIAEGEPQILYTALHHAREPMSLSQMIFYMWYLLENYETDDEVRYIVDQTEMHFIPCVNPDGYIYNHAEHPNGGGMWRKNRRINGDGTIGVDLNRNYSFEWGLDDNGSSSDSNDEIYRGTAPFSEPETQAIKDYCESNEFKIALNNHSFGNVLIYPFGHIQDASQDITTLNSFANLFTEENEFRSGRVFETLGYFVNGDSDSWMYGESLTKEPIIAMTPELGPNTFWPNQEEIIPLSNLTLKQNLMAAWVLLNYGIATDASDKYFSNDINDFDFKVRRYGFKDGILTASLSSSDPNVTAIGQQVAFSMNQNETQSGNIIYTVSNNVALGDTIFMTLSLSNGAISWEQEIFKIKGNPVQEFDDPFEDAENWQNFNASSTWDLSFSEFYSNPFSLADSPFSDYENNISNVVTLKSPISLVNADNAELKFKTKWEIEPDNDYVQIKASDSGNIYYPLCGKYTRPGSISQASGQPLYDGTQSEWVSEEMSLIDFIGGDLYLQFAFTSDGDLTMDGIYIDDIEVISYENGIVNVVPISASDFSMIAMPVPASDFVTLEISMDKHLALSHPKIEILNAVGQQMYIRALSSFDEQKIEIDVSQWSEGIYVYRLVGDERISLGQKFVVTK